MNNTNKPVIRTVVLYCNGESVPFDLLERTGKGISSERYNATRRLDSKTVTRALTRFCPSNLEKGSKAYIAEKERFLKSVDLQCELGNHDKTTNQTAQVIGVYTGEDEEIWIETTWVNAVPLSEIAFKDKTISEYLHLVSFLLKAARGYHEEGYLLMSLKPQNVMCYVSSYGVQGVRIMDFGSMIEKTVLHNSKERSKLLVSYSPKWSSPELKRDAFEEVNEKTDIYSIGLMLFNYLFGRLPEDPWSIDEEINELLTESNYLLRYFDSKDIVRKQLMSLLAGMLEYHPEDRLASGEAIQLCERLADIIKPKETGRLNSRKKNLPKATSKFILGERENEEKQVLDLLCSQRGPVVLQAAPGVGKSELIADFCMKYSDRFDFYYLTYESDLQHTILNLPIDPSIKSVDFDSLGRITHVPDAERFDLALDCLKKYDKDTVIVIDNLDDPDDSKTHLISDLPEYKKLLKLSIGLLATSRYGGFSNAHIVEMKESEQICTELLKVYIPNESDEDIIKLIHAVKCNTLIVDIVGKTLYESAKSGTGVTLGDMLSALDSCTVPAGLEPVSSEYRKNESPKDVIGHLNTLYDISRMSEYAQAVLMFSSLLPVNGISSHLVKGVFSDKKYSDAFSQLVATGWIREKGVAGTKIKYYLHPAVISLIKSKMDERDEVSICSLFIRSFADSFCSYASKTSKSGKRINRLLGEDLEFADKIAKMVLISLKDDTEASDSAAKVFAELSNYYYDEQDRSDLVEEYSSNAIDLLESVLSTSTVIGLNGIRLRLAEQMLYRGILFYDTERFEQSQKDFNKALSLLEEIRDCDDELTKKRDTVKAMLYERRGELLQGTGEWDIVYKDYETAIQLATRLGDKKELARAYRCRGIAYGDNGRILDSIRELKKGLDIADHKMRAYNCVGLYLSMTGLYEVCRINYEKGWQDYKDKRKDSPIFLLINMITCYTELGLYDKAVGFSKIAIKHLFGKSGSHIAREAIKLLGRRTADADLDLDDYHWRGSAPMLLSLRALYAICGRDGKDVNRKNADKLLECALRAGDESTRTLCRRIYGIESPDAPIADWAGEVKANMLTAAVLTKKLGYYYQMIGDSLRAYAFGFASYHLYKAYNYPFGMMEAAELVEQTAHTLSVVPSEEILNEGKRSREKLDKEKAGILELKDTELKWLFE